MPHEIEPLNGRADDSGTLLDLLRRESLKVNNILIFLVELHQMMSSTERRKKTYFGEEFGSTLVRWTEQPDFEGALVR